MTISTTITIPDRVWKLYETKDQWTGASFARDIDGNSVPMFHNTATCWCLSAAVSVVYREQGTEAEMMEKVRHLLKSHPCQGSAIKFNDKEGYDAVVAFCKENDI